MFDQYGRKIDYLRISLTDRCNLRCRYCRPETGDRLKRADILSYEELWRLCAVFCGLGIDKFKITGGEPLLRRGWFTFIEKLKALPQVRQVTLTTNGSLLEEYIPQLAAVGIDGVNISLDSVDAASYRAITGSDVRQVLSSIDAAYNAGLKVKINCVPLAQFTEHEILQLAELARERKMPVRFIELMPLGCNFAERGRTGAEVRQILQRAGIELTPDGRRYGNGPARYYRARGYAGAFGFIEPVHAKFCGACNRARLTSAGFLKPCLYYSDGLDLKALLRSGADDDALAQAVRQALYHKPRAHQFEMRPAHFDMNQIGG